MILSVVDQVASWPAALVAVFTTLVSGIGAFLAAKANENAKASRVRAEEINNAVNHAKERGTPRLYDLALGLKSDMSELLEWKRGHRGGPLDTGAKAAEFATGLREDVAGIGGRLDTVDARVARIERIHMERGCCDSEDSET